MALLRRKKQRNELVNKIDKLTEQVEFLEKLTAVHKNELIKKIDELIKSINKAQAMNNASPSTIIDEWLNGEKKD